MIVAVRRLLAGAVLGVVAGLGPAVGDAFAETASPIPVATASATASASAGSGDDAEAPDVAPDNSRTLLAVAAAGVLALGAAVVVFARRR